MAGVPRGEGQWVAAAARVEPVSEEILLSFPVTGVLESIAVQEGQRVTAGTVVARVRDDVQQASLRRAQEQLAARRAALERLSAGARPERQQEARAEMLRARTVMENARREAERRQELVEQDHLAQEAAEQAWTRYRSARQQYEQARQQYLQTSTAREEDVAEGLAMVEQARAELDQALAVQNKTALYAPLNATVLRLHRREGEVVSEFYESPVMTVGDVTRLRLRAEVDEQDVDLVREGQEAYARADAFGAERFPGVVEDVGEIIGPKRIFTGEPRERKDRQVLEVLIRLDRQEGLLPGLRMDAFIRVDDEGSGQGE
jgi:multidrug resistance efflux pump